MTDYIVLSEALFLRAPTNLLLQKGDVADLKEIGLDAGRVQYCIEKGFVAEYTDAYKKEQARLIEVETKVETDASKAAIKVISERGKRKPRETQESKAAKKAALDAALKANK